VNARIFVVKLFVKHKVTMDKFRCVGGIKKVKKTKNGAKKLRGGEIEYVYGPDGKVIGSSGTTADYAAKDSDYARRFNTTQNAAQAQVAKDNERAQQERAREDAKDAKRAEIAKKVASHDRFQPVVNALVKAGDFAADAGKYVGVPSAVSNVYKAFAPPGSKYYKKK
jgi:hypothetical protein